MVLAHHSSFKVRALGLLRLQHPTSTDRICLLCCFELLKGRCNLILVLLIGSSDIHREQVRNHSPQAENPEYQPVLLNLHWYQKRKRRRHTATQLYSPETVSKECPNIHNLTEVIAACNTAAGKSQITNLQSKTPPLL